MYEARVSERPCVGCEKTACVRSLYTREMSVAMNEHVAASPGVSVNAIVCSMSLVARGSMSARVRGVIGGRSESRPRVPGVSLK